MLESEHSSANTYHLDQNVRGFVSSKNNKIGQSIRDRISNRYPYEKHEAILPFAVLEYAGIQQKKILQNIQVPKGIEEIIERLVNFLKSEFREKLPKSKINQGLENNLKYSNEYAKPFLKGCIDILPETYDLIIAQLSWDRLSYLEWVSLDIEQIARSLCEKPYLYALRHYRHIQPFLPKNRECLRESGELGNLFLQVIKKMKLKPNQDIGDCEFIHTAIHGQPSIHFKKTRIVDCYTMDPPDEIKRRLIYVLFFYECLEKKFNYTLNMKYSGKIYILDRQTGEEKEEIIVKNYMCKDMLKRIKKRDSKILNLLS